MSITKLSIFDFDHTLFDVPFPSRENLILWHKSTGSRWRHNTWWDEDDSMDMQVFDIAPKHNIIKEVKRSFKDTSTYTVLLSGRPINAINGVYALLDSQDINNFDEYLLNNQNRSDLKFKLNKLDILAVQYPDCLVMDFWDDREEYADTYKAWGIKNFGTGFSYFLVK